MNIVILTDKSNISFYNWATRIYDQLKNKINVNLIDVESNASIPSYGSTVLQFLQPDYYKCFANCKNIGVSKLPVEYPCNHIVDEVWQDFPDVIIDVKNINLLNMPHLEGEFIFYSILEDHPEYIENILYAFTKEFDPAEPASLILKTSNVIDDTIYKVNTNLKMYDSLDHYKKHTIISRKYNSLQERFSLHVNCDAFLNPNKDLILYKDELEFFNKKIIKYESKIEDLQVSMRNTYNARKNEEHTSSNKDVVFYLMEKLYAMPRNKNEQITS